MSSNVSGKAYALTMMCPIKSGTTDNKVAFADAIRDELESWNAMATSPMALIPNTYLCRHYILDDVCTQALPGAGIWDTISDILPMMPASWRRAALPYEDHLKSRYLFFRATFTASLNPICTACGKAPRPMFGLSGNIATASKASAMQLLSSTTPSAASSMRRCFLLGRMTTHWRHSLRRCT